MTWQRWHASLGGCDVPFVYPNSCQDEPPPLPAGVIGFANPDYDTTVDMFGLVGGVRVELPVSAVYAAVGAEVTGAVDATQASPGAAFTGQLTFTFGFRNHQTNSGVRPARPQTESDVQAPRLVTARGAPRVHASRP